MGSEMCIRDRELPLDIIEFIAQRVKSNIRRLEGALVRVATFRSLGKGDLSMTKVEFLLKDILREEASRKATIESIQKAVAEFYGLRVADMTGRRRPKNVVHARQVAMFLSRRLTSNSLMQIGDAFGGRDHGTIVYACKKLERMIQADEDIKQMVDILETQLNL